MTQATMTTPLLPAFAATPRADIGALVGRVLCADALELLAQLPDASVDMVLCDLPYGEVNKASSGLRVLDKGIADIVTFDLATLVSEVARVTKQWAYLFCSTEQVSLIRGGFQPYGMTRLMIWQKTNPTPLNGEYMWLSDTEQFVALRKPKGTFNQFCHSSVIKGLAGSSELHPTQKPVWLMEYLILASTNPNDIILDFCAGSGTTAIAARKTGRRFICGDNSPEYVALANRRLVNSDPYQNTTLPDGTKQLSLLALLESA